MPVTFSGSIIVVTGNGDHVIKGPVDITGIVVPKSGTVTLKRGEITLLTLSAGTHAIKLRSVSDITVNGACSINLR